MSTHQRSSYGLRHRQRPADGEDWRRQNLLDAGFPPALAASVAVEVRDLHAMLQLVDRGCPPALAARILAPLPSEMGS